MSFKRWFISFYGQQAYDNWVARQSGLRGSSVWSPNDDPESPQRIGETRNTPEYQEYITYMNQPPSNTTPLEDVISAENEALANSNTGAVTNTSESGVKPVAPAPAETIDTGGSGGTGGIGDTTGFIEIGGNLYYKDVVANGKTTRYYFDKLTDGTFAWNGNSEEITSGTKEDTTFASYTDAIKYRDENNLGNSYIPVQGSNGRWILQYKEDNSKQEKAATDWQQAQLDWEKQKWAEQQKLERDKYLATLKQTPRDWIRYSEEAYGLTPAAPTWLAKYNPQIQAGSTLTAANTPAPSGQWLNRAKPTTRDMLLGYADWSANKGIGMTGDDLLSQTEQMLPTSSPYERNVWKPTKVAGW